MTIVVGGDHRVLEQITKQLNKLVEVIKVVDYSETAAVERELALIKVNAEPKDRSEIMQIVGPRFEPPIAGRPPSNDLVQAGSEATVDAGECADRCDREAGRYGLWGALTRF